ncbi:hypothetical protein NK6_8686 [Bradyrhizobium diazoefficiens]|uniref:Uncharacterized protein n=1 Tax=Bradyrhizobium diazoefficiens TaxID=1355477 RepID=A0A0E4FZJ7_9BRAD|nr:hypothetical protein NK6_8686 [Bradyrhizobium diazoefficiens]
MAVAHIQQSSLVRLDRLELGHRFLLVPFGSLSLCRNSGLWQAGSIGRTNLARPPDRDGADEPTEKPARPMLGFIRSSSHELEEEIRDRLPDCPVRFHGHGLLRSPQQGRSLWSCHRDGGCMARHSVRHFGRSRRRDGSRWLAQRELGRPSAPENRGFDLFGAEQRRTNLMRPAAEFLAVCA